MNEENVLLAEKEQTQIDVNAFIPLGAQLIDNSRKQAEAQVGLQKESLRLKEKELVQSKLLFKHKFWLLVLIVVIVFSISIGLIFSKNDTASGMSLLSHIGAVVVGIIAGSGWERSQHK